MVGRIPWSSLALSVLVLGAPRFARADPGLTTVDRETVNAVQSREPPAAPATPAAAGSTHVFEAFRHHADDLRSQRIASSESALILGAALVGTGVYIAEEWNRGFGIVVGIAGGVSMVGGGLTLIFRTEVENLADEHAVYLTSNPSAEQEGALERDWGDAAEKSKLARQLGGGIGLGLSAVALGGTVYVIAAGNVKDETRRWLAPTLILSATVAGTGGLVALMVESPTETAYGAFRATREKTKARALALTNVRVGAAPIPNGGWVGVSAAF
jgi:hypothetical protein